MINIFRQMIKLGLITGLLIIASCKSDSGFKGKIGMTCMDLTNPFFKLIANIMQEESAKYGYELVALSGNLDPARQNNQLLDLMHPRPESRLYLIKRYMIHHSSSRERWPGARFALLSITWKVKN